MKTEKNPSYIKQLEEENSSLKEQIDWFRRQIFGKRSEKSITSLDEKQLEFEGFKNLSESKEEEPKKVKAHERKKSTRHGKDAITLPPDLPVERIILDIPEADKICSETGKALVQIGEEVSLKLAHKPGSYYIKEIVRPKYAFPKGAEEGICVADMPESFLPKCRADESLLADILVKKFADHLPLYRISEILSREGIRITRQVLSQWVLRSATALAPLYEEMKRKILQGNNVFIDESPIKMLQPGKGKAHQAYMWVLVGGDTSDPPYRIYDFRLNRKHHNATEILSGYTKAVHSDKYGAYEAIANRKQITWCPCWAHIRRKFFEAESGDPAFRKWVLRKIRYLFMLEKIAWNRSAEERLRIRQEKEQPILDELIQGVKDRLIKGKVLPKSKFREALGYFSSLIPHLKNYTKDPYSRLDNNVAERAVRPLAIGRKNWMFVGSDEGGKSAGILLSLIQTCRAIGINPREYLTDIMRRIMSHSINKLEELLPDAWKRDCKSSEFSTSL
jgi:transposase